MPKEKTLAEIKAYRKGWQDCLKAIKEELERLTTQQKEKRQS